MPFNILKEVSQEESDAFNFYDINLDIFLNKFSSGQLFDFVGEITNEYLGVVRHREIERTMSFSMSDISGHDDRISIDLYYMGLLSFFKNIGLLSINIDSITPVENIKPSPLPLNAFDYKGFNNLDAVDSKLTYGLLFE